MTRTSLLLLTLPLCALAADGELWLVELEHNDGLRLQFQGAELELGNAALSGVAGNDELRPGMRLAILSRDGVAERIGMADAIAGFLPTSQWRRAEASLLAVTGRALRLQGYEDGYFLGGCLFDSVTTDMSIYRNEIFGPFVSVVRAEAYEDAVRMINEHEYGNGTAIFTRDGDTARDFFSRVRIGMVGVNVPIPVPVAYHSFGGWKRSLFGDHHIHGMEGVRFNTRLKTMTTRWPSGIREGAVFNFHAGSETTNS